MNEKHTFAKHIVKQMELNLCGSRADTIYYIRFVDVVMMVNYAEYSLDISFSRWVDDEEVFTVAAIKCIQTVDANLIKGLS